MRLAYAEKCADKSAALKREAALKRLPKADKEALAARWAADNKITLRMATPDDAAAVCALYNWYVRHGTQIFQYALSNCGGIPREHCPCGRTRRLSWPRAPTGGCRALPVRTCGMSARRTRGMSRRRLHCALTARPGVGGRLYRALLALVKAQGYYNAFALVAGNNRQSNDFHRAMGFKKMATEKRTGYKFGQWLDLDYWVMVLHEGGGKPAAIRKTLTDAEIAEAMGGMPPCGCNTGNICPKARRSRACGLSVAAWQPRVCRTRARSGQDRSLQSTRERAFAGHPRGVRTPPSTKHP